MRSISKVHLSFTLHDVSSEQTVVSGTDLLPAGRVECNIHSVRLATGKGNPLPSMFACNF